MQTFLTDKYRTNFSDNYFDAVTLCDVVEHVLYPELILEEVRRILKPGGIVIISTPVRLCLDPLDKYHSVEWFKEDFENFRY